MGIIPENKRSAMNKKAMIEWGYLAIIILAIVSLTIGSLAVARVVSKLPDEAGQIVCKNSVSLRANAALSAKGPSDIYLNMRTTPLLCKTRDVQISGTKLEVEQKLADLLSLCWWTFGEGKYSYTIENFFSSDTCFACFSVTIKDIKDPKTTIGVQEFEDWLKTNTNVNKNVTYYQYLTNFENIPGVVALYNIIEEKKTYKILYSDPKGSITGEHDVPNGLYFTDANIPPKTQAGFTFIGIPIPYERRCSVIEDIQGS